MPLHERQRAVVRALVATFAPLTCDAPLVVNAVETALDRLAGHRRTRLVGLLDVLASPWPSVLVGGFAPFAALPQHRREMFLRELCDSPLPLARTGFQAFKRLCCFMAYAAHDERGDNPLWPAIGYPGAIAGAPDLAPLGSDDPPPTADVVVVGSGAGGAVAAAAFARAGRSVAILEAGPALDARAPALELDSFAAYYLDAGLTASDDLGVAILAGAGAGGGTAVNWCTSLPLPAKTAQQWREFSAVDFEDLSAHYAAVRERLSVRPIDAHNGNNAALVRGCTALGWHVEATPRNAVGCGDGCGYCGFGCRFGCKRSADATYLRDATAAGARLTCDATVERVILDGPSAAGVRGTRAAAGARVAFTIRAPLVVVAAGSLRSPGILARSGVRSVHLGKHLRVHPTTAVFAGFEEPVETWRGPMQSAHSDAFADLDGDGFGARLEVSPAHPGLAALALPWRDRASHAATMTRFRSAAAFIILTRDRGEGAVSLDGRDDVRYRLDAYDAEHMRRALVGAAEVALAAGATTVSTLHSVPLELHRDRATSAARREFATEVVRRSMAANRIGVFSAHQMGTCRMHADPARGVVDGGGRVHGVRGLLVVDASAFPAASGVNPMLTIMALASRAAELAGGMALPATNASA